MKIAKSFWSILIGVAVAIGATLAAREFFAYDNQADDLSSWGVYYSVFGVIYAIIAGFLLVEVLQRFGNLSTVIEEELNALKDTRDFLLYIDSSDKKVKKDIEKALKEYAESVVETEWVEMMDLSQYTDSDTSDELRNLIIATNGINVTNASDEAALAAIMREISGITTQRAKRIALADAQLPPRLIVLLAFMSLSLLAGFIFMGAVNMWVHLFLVGTVTAAIQLTYNIIQDLNTPFDGVWNVPNDQYKIFIESLEKKSK